LRTTDLVEDYDAVECACEDARDYAAPADSEFFDYGFSIWMCISAPSDFWSNWMTSDAFIWLCMPVPMRRAAYKLAERLRILPITIAPISSAYPQERRVWRRL